MRVENPRDQLTLSPLVPAATDQRVHSAVPAATNTKVICRTFRVAHALLPVIRLSNIMWGNGSVLQWTGRSHACHAGLQIAATRVIR